MARALDATQAELVRRSHIAPVTLVKLTTYSNRVAETVDKIFYLSNLPVRYDYGNLGTDRDFLPVITGGGQFVSGFQHVPEPENLTAFGQALDLEVSNLPINGSPFVLILQEHNLEGARIEISQLLLPEIGSLPLDLTGHAGDEHTVLFRGRINRLSPIQEFNFTIQCRADLPAMANEWIYASDATKVDPRDIGKRIPRAYGFAKHVPVITWEVGSEGTLSEAIDATEDDVDIFVDTTVNLPNSPTVFTVKIDAEQIQCTKASATEIHIELGGRGSSAAHAVGAKWTEIIDANVWILSDKESDAIPIVYSVDDLTGELVRIEESVLGITKNLADTTTIPGRTVTSMSIESKPPYVEFLEDVSLTDAPANTLHRGRNRDFASSGSTYFETTGASRARLHHDNISALKAERGVMTYTLYLTKGAGGFTGDLEIKIDGTSGEEVVSTITGASMAAAGATPSAHTFVIDNNLYSSESTDSIILDPTVSGDFRVFDCSRSWPNHAPTKVFQEGDSCTGNITGAGPSDYDKVIDGDDGTFLSFTGTDNEEIVVTFLQPAGISLFFHQFVDVLMKVNGTSFFVVETVTADDDIIILNSLFAGAITPEEHFVYEHDSGSANQNIIRFRTTESTDFGDIHSITRTALVLTFVPPRPTQQLFADIDGVVAPDGTYDAASGEVLIHPADIIKHWIVEVGGETIDSTSYDALVTSLGASAEWGFDARGMGFTWAEVLARMAYEARCNVIPVETTSGRVWKLLAADNGYGFGAPPSGSIIGQVDGLIDEGRSIDDLASFFNFRYKYDAGLFAGGSEEAFTEILLATPDVSDVPITTTIISDAADRFGDIEAQPINYRATQDNATAQDTSGYLVQERIANKRRVFRIGNVAWFDALPHDVGDIVSITPPWDTVAVTCRLTEMRKGFDSNTWSITAIEVLETGTRT